MMSSITRRGLRAAATSISIAAAFAIVTTVNATTQSDPADAVAKAPPATLVPAEIAPLAPLLEHPRTSSNVVEQLRRNHYVSKSIDDALSSAMLDKYLSILDGNKSYFLASDIAEFEALRYELDDALKASDLAPAFRIFNRYQDRLLQRLDYSLKLLQQGLETFDFATDESLQIDREQAQWPKDENELDDLWRRRLKSQVLSLRLNDKSPEDILDTLTKRLRNQLKMLERNKSEDAFQVYMNAFASTFDHIPNISRRALRKTSTLICRCH